MGALDGRVAVITGAGRGIGREHALLFAREGAAVIVNDLGGANDGSGSDVGPAQAVVNEIKAAGGAAFANTDNIATWDGAAALVAQAVEEFGQLDAVVNNAGILRDGFIPGLDEDQWDSVINVHLKGHFAVLHHAAKYWKEQSKAGATVRGSVLNTASASGTTMPNAGQANYGAAKAGIAALTLVAAGELERYGVRVNAIAPIARTRLTLATPGFDVIFKEPDDPDAFDAFSPANISPLVAYLSTENCPATGKVYDVQGGAITELGGWHAVRTTETDKPWTIDEVEQRLLGWSSLHPLRFWRYVVIGWSDTELAIQAAIREFVDKEIRPHADALEDGEMLPYPIIRKLFSTFGVDAMALDSFKKTIEKERARAAGEEAEPSDSVPGGSGNEAMTLILSMELCKVNMGLTSAMGVSMGLAAGTIMSRGSIEQKERWAADLLSFEKVGAWAITEPDSGSDAFGGMRTTVRPKGDGYVLNGEKTFITNGPYADTSIVYAKLDDGSGVDIRKRPVLTFVLDTGMEGFTQSKPFKKMGIHASPTGQLFFSDVYLEPDRLLGDPSAKGGAQDGRESARSNFVAERLGIAAMSLGVIEECLRLCVDYAKKRELWGQRIGDFQLIQLKLANMEVARLNVEGMVFRALELRKMGKSPTLAEASAMKYYSSQAATEVAMEAVQLFGGNGYMSEYRVEQLARDAKSLMIYAGSNEVQITHIAKDLLA